MKVNIQSGFCRTAGSAWLGLMELLFPAKCLCCKTLIYSKNSIQGKSDQLFVQNDEPVKIMFERLILDRFYCRTCFKNDFSGIDLPSFAKSTDGFVLVPEVNDSFRDGAKGSHSIQRIKSSARYHGMLRRCIHDLKYHGKIGLSEPLGLLLFKTFWRCYGSDDFHAIVPVPLHRSALVQRGFNQVFLLIRHFRTYWEIVSGCAPPVWRIDPDQLIRVKKTLSQTGFDRQGRVENIRGAFMVRKPSWVDGKRILLVDDVLTTGATVKEAASVLRDAGALSVDVLTLARV